MLKAIKHAKETHETYDYDKSGSGVRKEIQCSFRLMNVLFSDRFSCQLGSLGNTASREQLDGGHAANDETFWRDVRSSFVSEDPEFGTLQFADSIFTSRGIDVSNIVEHDWKKLRCIWKQVNSDYRCAVRKYTQSGTHASDFFSFCNGKIDVFYLRKLLELKPELNATVQADLPTGAFCNSAATTQLVQPPAPPPDAQQSPGSRKRKYAKAETGLEHVLRQHTEASQQAEAEKLRQIEKMDARHSATLKLLEEKNELERKRQAATEHHMATQGALEKWNSVRDSIKKVRQEIHIEQDATAKKELQEDLQMLLEMKDQLQERMGMRIPVSQRQSQSTSSSTAEQPASVPP
eukprot:GHVU01222823.1.p1 GENE.GHVU01222823.1~~GHVU01222823.1.p1  ORF type:complete len:349 (+),score=51.81 GHVU01222823.1:1031-2077(+)